MNIFIKIVITYLLMSQLVVNIFSQNFVEPIASYTFNNNNVVDEKGYSELLLQSGAALHNDGQRGAVLRFSAVSKSYAAINKNLLNSDSATISFFFYWESTNSSSWHQLFEVFDPNTNNNIFFTPQNGWGSNMCSFISDNKEYSKYEAVSGSQLAKETWMHIAITVKNRLVTLYVNGVENSRGYITCPVKMVVADSTFFGGNPHRTDNYYISARLDDIKVFDKTLAANQIAALNQEIDIPAPENQETVWETSGSPIQIEIDLADKKQTIQNFGSSDGWNTERIGKYWPEAKKEKLAELLFSKEKDADGNPKGIGLSAWRFNIGAGTAEQGDASRIHSDWRRTECFLNSDGSTYDWTKQLGQQWFLKKAAIDYNINHIIGWQNSPPVLYTNNNLGFRDYGQPMSTILKAEHFDDFAHFLADVIIHFEGEGVDFDYISPLNEPQYGWAPTEAGGTVSQEGTPWTNQEIFDVVSAIDNEFSNRNIGTKAFITEAGSIQYHLDGIGHASNQLYNFWNQSSSRSLVGKTSFANIVSYHSYWKDFGSDLVNLRDEFFNRANSLTTVPEAWQTEYSLLGDGYRTGYPTNYKLTEMECALSLAKVIMTDLNVTNTTGWQWWSTFGQGKHGGEARFCLIEAITKIDNTDGDYHLNKLFYTFGNFSHFIRPGMTRLGITRSDNLTPLQQTSNIMLSSYLDEQEGKIVIVAVNHTEQAKEVNLSLINSSGQSFENPSLYLTNEFTNLALQNIDLSSGTFIVPSKSVVTYSASVNLETSINEIFRDFQFKAWFNPVLNNIAVKVISDTPFQKIKLYSITGTLLQTITIDTNKKEVYIPASGLSAGLYLVSVEHDNFLDTKKVVVIK